MSLSPHRPSRARLRVQELESRCLPAAPGVAEQVFLERLNDARANPAAYGTSIGLNLANVAPSQPLAFDPRLIDAARAHSADMNARNYFSHTGAGGTNAGQRMNAAGYPWNTWGESLAAGYHAPDDALKALVIDAGVPDLGHRRHLLAMDGAVAGHRAVGVGAVQNGAGMYQHYYTIDTGADADGRAYLTGVVYADANGNNRYDAGEGLGNVPVSVAGVGTVATWSTGGYSVRVGPGTYAVTVSGGAHGGPVTQQVTVGSANVRLNFTPGAAVSDDYVTKVYERVLGRAPHAAEMNLWASVAQAQGRAAVANLIERSAEARGRVVRDWYKTYLGREAGAADVSYWVNVMGSGAPEEAVLSHILGSAEYQARAASRNGGGDAGFVRGLYKQILGRDAGADEVAYWRKVLPWMGGAGVASFFVRSSEYRTNQVQSYYRQLMKRAAGASELGYWVNSGLDLTALRVVFTTSNEFVNG